MRKADLKKNQTLQTGQEVPNGFATELHIKNTLQHIPVKVSLRDVRDAGGDDTK